LEVLKNCGSLTGFCFLPVRQAAGLRLGFQPRPVKERRVGSPLNKIHKHPAQPFIRLPRPARMHDQQPALPDCGQSRWYARRFPRAVKSILPVLVSSRYSNATTVSHVTSHPQNTQDTRHSSETAWYVRHL
jgi:hypothetical protein